MAAHQHVGICHIEQALEAGFRSDLVQVLVYAPKAAVHQHHSQVTRLELDIWWRRPQISLVLAGGVSVAPGDGALAERLGDGIFICVATLVAVVAQPWEEWAFVAHIARVSFALLAFHTPVLSISAAKVHNTLQKAPGSHCPNFARYYPIYQCFNLSVVGLYERPSPAIRRPRQGIG